MFRIKALTPLLSNTIKVFGDTNVWTARTLYSASTLGLDGFMTARERVKLQVNNVDGFKTKMTEFVTDENSKNLIFTEDLKNMLHISESPEDVQLLTTMIQKFCTQSKDVRFGNFVFGPPIMRLFHTLKDADSALKLFKDESLDGFFDQLISYQLLLDMLYELGRYQEMVDTYHIIKERQIQGGRYPKHVLVLTFAACYKLNTPASFEFATNLWKELHEAGHFPMRRATTFMAHLAIKQGAPHIALEVVSIVKQQNYLTIRTIKALAFAASKRYDDVVPILRSVLEVDNPMANKQTFPSSAIEELKKAFEEVTNKDLQADFKKVIGFLEKHGHITPNTLEDILCAEIVQTMQFPGTGRDDSRYQGNRDEFRGGNRDRDDYRGGNRDDYRGGNDRRGNRDEYRGGNDRRGGFNNRRDDFENPTGRARRPGLHELN